MPNQPKTPVRTVRVPDELWDRVRLVARARGVSVSDVVRELIEAHVPEASVDVSTDDPDLRGSE